MKCEMCGRKTKIRNVTAMECDAQLCRACIDALKKDGHEVADHGPVRNPQ